MSPPALVCNTSLLCMSPGSASAPRPRHPQPGFGLVEAGRGLGVGDWGHITIGLGGIWGLWVNKAHPLAQAGTQAVAEEPASPLRLSHLPGHGVTCTSNSLFNLR